MKWKYYNYAAIPTTAPHEKADLSVIEDGSLWKMHGMPLLARWSSDWDVEKKTQWWYCIKDEPFSIENLKSKRRYEIKKGKKFFEVKKINIDDYMDSLIKITIEAYSGWPSEYRPKIYVEDLKKDIIRWKEFDVFGAFSRENGGLCGFAVLKDMGSWADFAVLRVKPSSERFSINAVIVAEILVYYKDRFDGSFYVCDGSRTIRHETDFQDYLEKYFNFRKAYCRLNIKYRNMWIFTIISLIYPFRGLINRKSNIGNKIFGLLKMEEIKRSFG